MLTSTKNEPQSFKATRNYKRSFGPIFQRSGKYDHIKNYYRLQILVHFSDSFMSIFFSNIFKLHVCCRAFVLQLVSNSWWVVIAKRPFCLFNRCWSLGDRNGKDLFEKLDVIFLSHDVMTSNSNFSTCKILYCKFMTKSYRMMHGLIVKLRDKQKKWAPFKNLEIFLKRTVYM